MRKLNKLFETDPFLKRDLDALAEKYHLTDKSILQQRRTDTVAWDIALSYQGYAQELVQYYAKKKKEVERGLH